MTTVAAALADARSRGVASLDAQLLLARVLKTTRTRLITDADRSLVPDETDRWSDWLERRAGGEPLAYLFGEKEFHGLLLEVGPAVLVPRPETELLVDWAAERIGPESSLGPAGRAGGRPRVVDLGIGSGAIALALKRMRPRAQLLGTDLSAAALAVAQRNAVRLGLEIELVLSSWWSGIGGRRFDVVVANPPYIAADDEHLYALRHEPLSALTPGGDGLAALEAIVGGAPDHLEPGGSLLLEHGSEQAAPVRDLLARAGFEAIETRRDLAGLARATGGRRSLD